MTGTICGDTGLAWTNPGIKNIKGEKLWVVLIPLHPVPKPITMATSAKYLINEPTLTV